MSKSHIAVYNIQENLCFTKIIIQSSIGDYVVNIRDLIKYCELKYQDYIHRSKCINEGNYIHAITRFGVINLKSFLKEIDFGVIKNFIDEKYRNN